jgi:hypothetical protein
MSVAERQAMEPEDIFDLWVHWERGPMLVDDIRALPRSPMIVVEGTTVPADQRPTLWLDRPSARPDHPVWRRYVEGILAQAERHGVPVLTVDGSVEQTISAVEGHFADELAAGPRAETLDERRALLREANEALVFQVRTGTARPWATETPETLTRDFICECDDPECRATLVLTAAEFDRRAAHGPVTAQPV